MLQLCFVRIYPVLLPHHELNRRTDKIQKWKGGHMVAGHPHKVSFVSKRVSIDKNRG